MTFPSALRYLCNVALQSFALGQDDEGDGPESDGRLTAHRSIDDRLVELMRVHEGPLYRYLYLLTGDREAALDCAQDVFVRAYDNLRKGRPVNAGWLFTVGRNRAMDRFRRSRRESAAVESLQRLPLDGFESPERGAVMREAFSRLEADDRTLLYMFAVEGLSGKEIAERLGISHMAVRMRIMRARERFRVFYGGTA